MQYYYVWRFIICIKHNFLLLSPNYIILKFISIMLREMSYLLSRRIQLVTPLTPLVFTVSEVDIATNNIQHRETTEILHRFQCPWIKITRTFFAKMRSPWSATSATHLHMQTFTDFTVYKKVSEKQFYGSSHIISFFFSVSTITYYKDVHTKN